jgi:tetratricopeptide (TPR) repeat protein
MTRHSNSPVLRTSILAAGLAASMLAGCAGSKSYTNETTLEHNTKMEVMKSANEYGMARQSYFGGDLPRALKRIDASIAINNQVPKSHVLRGRIQLEMSAYDAALDSLHTAETLAPESVDAQYFLGVTYERLAEHADALTHYKAAAELDPEDAQYVVAVAEVLIDSGQVDEAERYVLSRRQRFDHNPGVRQTLGHIALIQDDYARALTMFTEARLLAPDDTDILEDLAHTQVTLGRFAEATASLSKLLKDEETAARRRDLRHMQGRCLIETGRYIEARDIYLTLTSEDEGAADVDAWIGLGNISCIIKDPYRHKSAARRTIALAPAREEGYLLYAIYHRRRGEFADALHYLELGSQHVADTNAIYTLAGVVLTDMGRTDEARQVLGAALTDDPTNQTVAGMLDSFDLSDD